jgi:hypothetical protein
MEIVLWTVEGIAIAFLVTRLGTAWVFRASHLGLDGTGKFQNRH